MMHLAKLGIVALLMAVFAATGAAETEHLSADQLAKAVSSDSISIPTPGELFAALGKTGKTDWSGQYRGPMPVTLGGWIRGTQVVTSAIMQNYDEHSAKVLRQPALVHFMQSKINEISAGLRGEPLVKDVSEQLGEIEKLVSFPPGKAPTVDEVRKINKAVGKAMEEMESKELPK